MVESMMAGSFRDHVEWQPGPYFFTQTIEIDGGATITFRGDGQNGRLISNFKKLVMPDVAPALQPYNGQFIQVDVVDVK